MLCDNCLGRCECNDPITYQPPDQQKAHQERVQREIARLLEATAKRKDAVE